MTTLAKLCAVLMLVLTLPALAVAAQRDPVDRFDAMRLRAEIRRDVRDAVRRARRDVWSARGDVWRARLEARREILRARREAYREAQRAVREARRHAWRW
jgi:regulator of protease activity HflC (stomatin/prohibitin superfamily)